MFLVSQTAPKKHRGSLMSGMEEFGVGVQWPELGGSLHAPQLGGTHVVLPQVFAGPGHGLRVKGSTLFKVP
jgi:hypothetical protein